MDKVAKRHILKHVSKRENGIKHEIGLPNRHQDASLHNAGKDCHSLSLQIDTVNIAEQNEIGGIIELRT